MIDGPGNASSVKDVNVTSNIGPSSAAVIEALNQSIRSENAFIRSNKFDIMAGNENDRTITLSDEEQLDTGFKATESKRDRDTLT